MGKEHVSLAKLKSHWHPQTTKNPINSYFTQIYCCPHFCWQHLFKYTHLNPIQFPHQSISTRSQLRPESSLSISVYKSPRRPRSHPGSANSGSQAPLSKYQWWRDLERHHRLLQGSCGPRGERDMELLGIFWGPNIIQVIHRAFLRKPMGFDVPPILRSTHVLRCEMRCDVDMCLMYSCKRSLKQWLENLRCSRFFLGKNMC